MLERLFHIRAAGSSVHTELLGGLTTFLTMAYIVVVNPGIVSGTFSGHSTGLSYDAALLATCLSAAVATLLMAFLANYPIAQAPGMGENAFFAGVIGTLAAWGFPQPWQVALGVVFISGVLFLVLSLVPFRRAVIDAVSPSLKNGIAVGIGLFIAFLGLRHAGVIRPGSPETLVAFTRNLREPGVVIFFAGLFATAALTAWRVRAAVLLGIVLTAVLAVLWKKVELTGVFGLPRDEAFFRLDLRAALRPECLAFIFVFLFMDVFDTVGTIIGVGEQGGFMRDNRLPRAGRALVSDAVGTLVGAVAGTSTVTSYIESAAGVASGARTGLASVATGFLFLVALFFTPLVAAIGAYPPITAPALVVVGAMMVQNVRRIDWADTGEALPAFLAMIGIPLTFSIADGLALGFVSYPVINVLAGRWRRVSWLMYLVAALFLARYLLIRG